MYPYLLCRKWNSLHQGKSDHFFFLNVLQQAMIQSTTKGVWTILMTLYSITLLLLHKCTLGYACAAKGLRSQQIHREKIILHSYISYRKSKSTLLRKLAHSFSFSKKRMYCTEKPKKQLQRKSQQISSLLWIPLIVLV